MLSVLLRVNHISSRIILGTTLATEGVLERLGDAPKSLLALIMVTSTLARCIVLSLRPMGSPQEQMAANLYRLRVRLTPKQLISVTAEDQLFKMRPSVTGSLGTTG
jgi:hypothetical protein